MAPAGLFVQELASDAHPRNPPSGGQPAAV